MESYITAEEIALMCDHAKALGEGYIASCPLHDDVHASLRISSGERATMLHCHTGCSTEAILEALGIQMQMLFYDYEPRGGSDVADLRTKMRDLQRELNPPPPLPNTFIGLMAECFNLEEPWHTKGMNNVLEGEGGFDTPGVELRYLSNRDTTVRSYFEPWSRSKGFSEKKLLALSDWGWKKLKSHWTLRLRQYR